jgi:hypothetical protein
MANICQSSVFESCGLGLEGAMNIRNGPTSILLAKRGDPL